ncbi:tape measure domain (tape_meas_nterm) [uncultured Mediterranean phage uvMED]|nr:tape measure domain (tape_meas_nterm) [uncultured Mediterranean phage uvMED]
MANELPINTQEAVENISKLEDKVLDLLSAIKKVDAEAKELNNSFKTGKLNDFNKSQKESLDLQNKLATVAIRNQKIRQEEQKTYQQLIRTQATSNKETDRQIDRTNRLEKAKIKETKATENQKKKALEANREFKKLESELLRVTKAYQDMAVKEGFASSNTQKLFRDVKRLRGEVDKIQKPIGNYTRNVGNYGIALKGVASAGLAAAGIVGVVDTIIRVGESAFETTRKLDSMNSAMNVIFDTQENVSKQNEFLIDLSDRYGSELISLTDSYNKFSAAAKGTNLEGEEAQRIFDVVTKASASLGLSAQDTEGALRALQQMMSKGKVTAEELTQQLNERLPGALKSLATGLGVSESELFKMMERGELLAEDTLPKLADGLEKTFNLDKISRVENLNASVNRLGNEWTKFIKDLNEGNGILSETFKTLVDGLTGSIKLTKEMTNVYFSSAEKLSLLGEAIINVSGFLYDITDGFVGVKKELQGLDREVINTITMFNNLVAQPKNIKFGLEPLSLPFDFSKSIGEDKLNQVNNKRSVHNIAGGKNKKASNNSQKEKIKLLKEERKELEKINEQLDENKDNYEVAVIKERAKELREAQKAIEDSLQNTSGNISESSSTPMIDTEADDEIKKMEELINMRDAIAEGFSDLGLDSVSKNFSDMFDAVLNESSKFNQKFAAGIAVIGSFASDLFSKQTDDRIESLDRENEAFQESQDKKIEAIERQLEAENLSAEEKEALNAKIEVFEAQKEEKEKQTKIRQFKTQQKADAIQALMNGALGATTTIARLGVPFGTAPAAISLGFGALQSAFILSKPVPEFYKGTSNAPEGYALTQERGAEMITDKKGNIKTLGNNKGSQMTYLNKGDKVYTANQTNDLLSNINTDLIDDSLMNSMILNKLIAPKVDISSLITKEEMYNVMDRTLSKHSSPTYFNDGDNLYVQNGNKYPKVVKKMSKLKNMTSKRSKYN